MEMDGEYSVATPVAYGEIPAGVAGLALCAIAIHASTTANGLGLILILPIAALGIVAVLIGVRSVIIRLRFSQDRLSMVVGPFERSIDLRELAEVGYRRSGRTAFYLLRDRRGNYLSVPVTRFKRDDEWKRLIVDSAMESGANMDPRARRSLEEADGTGRGFLL
jgi:hypothetical protein